MGVGKEDGRLRLVGFAGRGSYIADFGVLDVPHIGELRTRAGLRYSRLYPRGALELGFRKELRTDPRRGYELSLGVQTAGDDHRLDILADVGALKHFRGARAFYRLLWGIGIPFQEEKAGPGWNEMGSSLGVAQQRLPPRGYGELTVGWRTGLFDNSHEGVTRPDPARRTGRAPKTRKAGGLLDSTPYAAYAIGVPLGSQGARAQFSWTVLPEHDTLEHALRLRVPEDPTGGAATVSAVVDQSLRNPMRFRLRLGASYTRG